MNRELRLVDTTPEEIECAVYNATGQTVRWVGEPACCVVGERGGEYRVELKGHWLRIALCDICERIVDGGHLCNTCWEVYGRIEDFVRTPRGFRHTQMVLEKAARKVETI